MNIFTALKTGLVISALFASNTANAYERWINVTNNAGVTVREIYITHVDDPNLGNDLLREYLLYPGYQVEVEPEDPEGYCLFDIRVVYVDGSIEDFNAINLCEETDLWV